MPNSKKHSSEYLSWTQLNLFEQDPKLYRKVYLEGYQQPESRALKLGKALANRLESLDISDNQFIEHLALFLPKYQKREYEIAVDFQGIPLFGILDGFSDICPKCKKRYLK